MQRKKKSPHLAPPFTRWRISLGDFSLWHWFPRDAVEIMGLGVSGQWLKLDDFLRLYGIVGVAHPGLTLKCQSRTLAFLDDFWVNFRWCIANQLISLPKIVGGFSKMYKIWLEIHHQSASHKISSKNWSDAHMIRRFRVNKPRFLIACRRTWDTWVGLVASKQQVIRMDLFFQPFSETQLSQHDGEQVWLLKYAPINHIYIYGYIEICTASQPFP